MRVALPTNENRFVFWSCLKRVQLGLALFSLTSAAAAQIVIDGQVIAGGGGSSISATGCLTLDGTIGQAVVGYSSDGSYSLATGFWGAVAAEPRDSLFNSGFEECQ